MPFLATFLLRQIMRQDSACQCTPSGSFSVTGSKHWCFFRRNQEKIGATNLLIHLGLWINSVHTAFADGVLTGYVLGSYSACRLGLETTGNAGGVNNLIVQPGRFSAQELMQQMGSGLLVTEVMGQGVSIVTGDYSRGAAGFWIENGEIQFPVDEVTIAGNLKNMFMDIEAVGTDVDDRAGIQTGSILMGKMTVAGS